VGLSFGGEARFWRDRRRDLEGEEERECVGHDCYKRQNKKKSGIRAVKQFGQDTILLCGMETGTK
jgi:hypothetical protein